jgi:hypothetical protein
VQGRAERLLLVLTLGGQLGAGDADDRSRHLVSLRPARRG